MLRARFRGLIWWSTACWALTAAVAHGGAAAPASPETCKEAGVSTGFYEEIRDSNFDCPCDRRVQDAEEDRSVNADESAAAAGAGQAEAAGGEASLEEAAADGCASRSVMESLADWRHSAGGWLIGHINSQQDGLGETPDEEVDWSAVAEAMAAEKAEAEERDAGCDIEGNTTWDETGSAAEEPGYLSQWCGRVWQAMRETAESLAERLEQWSDEGVAAQGSAAASQVPEPQPRQPDDEPSPPGEKASPGLPNYFLPAFGSPWDGEL